MPKKEKKSTNATEVITSYKGFGSDWQCRGFQYEVGKSYEMKSAQACSHGFHACEHPLNVFFYYPPAGSKFAIVEQSGVLSRHDEDTKVASTKIKVKCEIGIPGLVQAAIEYVTSRCKPIDPESPASSTGYQGAASSTGKHGVAMASGFYGKAMGADGNALFLVYRDSDGVIKYAKAAIVGQDGIKPDVWYTLSENGEFIEAEDD